MGMSSRSGGSARLRLLGLVAVGLGASAFGVATGLGAAADTAYETQRVESPEPQLDAEWATRVAPARDLTGDGVSDVFIDSYVHDVYKGPGTACGQPEPNGCLEDAGKAYLVSGADGSIRYDITSPELQAGATFGFYVTVLGDVNADGKDDVLVGAPGQDVDGTSGESCTAGQPGCNADQGKVYVFSGPTGRLIRAINNPNPQANGKFGARLARAGDVTGDGIPDILVGAPNNDLPAGCGELVALPADCRKNEGEAFIFDGATGALVRTLNLPDRAAAPCDARCGNLGNAVGGPGDTDGDGVPDQLVGAPTGGPPAGGQPVGRSYVFSGRTGALLLRIDDPDPQPFAFFGFDVVNSLTPGDVNGDGFADIYASGFFQPGARGEPNGGRAWIFNGKTGAILYELKDPTPGPGQSFGFAATKTDYNKDGTPDIYVGAAPHEGGPDASTLDENGETHIFDGRDGSLLRSLLLPAADRQAATAANPGPNLGEAVGAPGDLNGDGEPDYIAGAFLADADGNQDQGRLYFFRSKLPPAPIAPATPGAPVIPAPTPAAAPQRPGLTAKVSPRRDRRKPFRFTTRGSLTLPTSVSRSAGCTGKVRVTVKRVGARKTLSRRLANVNSACRFTSTVRFKNARGLGRARGTLIFAIRFQGNPRLTRRSITRIAHYGA